MSTSVSRFRTGSHQRGEETRGRILESALELFAAAGFEGASTRAIAERAGVNLPAIQYYFGSKEGLYRAVVDQFGQQMVAAVRPIAARTETELASDAPSRERLLDLLCDMIDTVIALILDDSQPNRECRQRFFARMEVEPSPAFEALQRDMLHHVSQPCCAIIGRLIDRSPDDQEVLLHVMMLIGQAKIFCGWGVERVLGWTRIGDDQVRAVQTISRRHIRAVFAMPGDGSP